MLTDTDGWSPPVGIPVLITGGCTEYITEPQHLNTISLWCIGIVNGKARLCHFVARAREGFYFSGKSHFFREYFFMRHHSSQSKNSNN
ncbi:hypothetical protein [Gilliamella apis]|uniref:hypothetical protein n=1 Tax=Gilliamella apis TaxID=1970738 RepID=UPI0010561E42|nr:hypothetical protein [Gilliamella apis]